uniref:Glutathione synthetase n=1 Tax=Erpetoichthys calabaricus TaxID=27687 RepID=A0A8C4SIC3_ERPCA
MAYHSALCDILVDEAQLEQFALVAKDSAFRHGLLMRTKEDPNSPEVLSYAPFTLFPSPIPKSIYEQAKLLQRDFNLLVEKITQDSKFLEQALASIIKVDHFIARLFEIYRKTLQKGISSPITIGLIRSDYMFLCGEEGVTSLKQIEFNTISVGGGGLASQVPAVHRHILKVAGIHNVNIMDNNCIAILAGAIEKAWSLYGSQGSIIMFLVEDIQMNIYDQRLIENELWSRNIPVIRRRFEDISKRGHLDEEKRLFIDGQEVGLVYYRYGYLPQQYIEKDWEALLMMEQSRAVKCPNIGAHLAGIKKVQQELARPGVLEHFFPGDPEAVSRIRSVFAGLYSLDLGNEGDQALDMAFADPDQFVLKPQREGGGNNIYGDDICHVLSKVEQSLERTAFILMEKIRPQPVRNCILRRGTLLKIQPCINELGMFGVYVRHGTEMTLNEFAGHLLRTKNSEHNDGGLMAGVAALDSPYLV